MYAQQKPIENSRIVRERDRERLRELFAVCALGIPIGLFLLTWAWQNLEVIRLGRDATHLERQRETLQEEHRKLRLEIERLTALDDASARATKLGFVPVSREQIVRVSDPAREVAR